MHPEICFEVENEVRKAHGLPSISEDSAVTVEAPAVVPDTVENEPVLEEEYVDDESINDEGIEISSEDSIEI